MSNLDRSKRNIIARFADSSSVGYTNLKVNSLIVLKFSRPRIRQRISSICIMNKCLNCRRCRLSWRRNVNSSLVNHLQIPLSSSIPILKTSRGWLLSFFYHSCLVLLKRLSFLQFNVHSSSRIFWSLNLLFICIYSVELIDIFLPVYWWCLQLRFPQAMANWQMHSSR